MSRVLPFSRRAVLGALLSPGLAVAAGPGLTPRQRVERRLVLSGLRPGEVPRVRVAPGVVTVLLFDAELDREAVEREGRGRFARLEVAERALLVEPAEALEAGLLLEVGFADGLVPARIGLLLVTDPEVVDGQVEVERRALTEGEAREERCGALRPARLVLAGLLGEESLKSGRFKGGFVAEGMEMKRPWIHRASAWRVLFFRISNPEGAAPWAPGEAVLSDLGGEDVRPVPVFLDVPRLGPEESGVVVVELPPEPREVSWRLEIGEDGGDRRIRLERKTR